MKKTYKILLTCILSLSFTVAIFAKNWYYQSACSGIGKVSFTLPDFYDNEDAGYVAGYIDYYLCGKTR